VVVDGLGGVAAVADVVGDGAGVADAALAAPDA
jgi:hypothetical protein